MANKTDKTTTPTFAGLIIEVGVPIGNTTQSHNDPWGDFPKPTNPADPKTWPSVVFKNRSANSLGASIKKYREAEQKAGRVAPEFQISPITEPGTDGKKVATKDTRVTRKS